MELIDPELKEMQRLARKLEKKAVAYGTSTNVVRAADLMKIARELAITTREVVEYADQAVRSA
jgi:hypothetical protein